jgi:adenylate cyclase
MRIRGLQARARPFRYAGFWLLAMVCALRIRDPAWALPSAAAAAFCLLWPLLVDRALRWLPDAARRGRGGWLCYVGECALVAAALSALSLPPLPAWTTVLWLLGGAAALAGWPLALTSFTAMLPGIWLGMTSAPWAPPTPGSGTTSAADLLSLAVLGVFVLALALQSFRQALRLDAQRLALAERSAELERVNARLQRYLPPSLSDRVRRAPEEPWRWERCWLTVAFIDLAGFTRLAERLDAETLAALIDDYLGTLIPAVERRGGEVSKLLGDGLLAVFGGADAGQNRDRHCCARDAVLLCLEAPALVDRLATRWRHRGERVALAVRAGVASGLCTLGDRGGSGRLDFTLVGGTVNLASRLQTRAPENGVLLDEATGLLCAAAVPLSGPRLIEIDGLGRVIVYAPVDRPHPSAMVPAAPHTPGIDADGQGVSKGLPR